LEEATIINVGFGANFICNALVLCNDPTCVRHGCLFKHLFFCLFHQSLERKLLVTDRVTKMKPDTNSVEIHDKDNIANR
jgi:hypothetical protein